MFNKIKNWLLFQWIMFTNYYHTITAKDKEVSLDEITKAPAASFEMPSNARPLKKEEELYFICTDTEPIFYLHADEEKKVTFLQQAKKGALLLPKEVATQIMDASIATDEKGAQVALKLLLLQ